MVSLDDAVLARLETHGFRFEILVEPNKALAFRKGEQIPIEDILAVRQIFKDARSGEEQPENDLKKAFKTIDIISISEQILRKGTIQLTTKQKQEMTEDKRKQVVSMIVRRAADPQGRPHPPIRIENAMKEAGVHIDPLLSADEQIKKIIDMLRPIIPISMDNIKVAVRIPANFAAKCYGILKEFGKVEREEWQADGSLTAVVELPAGLQSEFYDRLNKSTQGSVETRIITK